MPTWVSLEPATTTAATGYLTTPGDPANLSDALVKVTPPVTDAWAAIKASESAIIHAIFAALDANGIAPFPGGAYEPVPAAAANGNFAMFDASRLVVDSGKKAADFAIAAHNHDLVYAPLTHTHAWADITSGLPATWAPSAHNHAFGDITSGLPATWAPSAHVHAITAATANNWKVFYSDGAGAVVELALGAQYKVLMSNAANAAPSFELLTNNNLAASGTANIAWNKLAASGNKGYAVITDAGTGYLTTEQYLAVGRGGTGTGALTEGSVVFAGSGGVYSQDNAKLFWDNSNKRLGVGNAAPAYPLDVTGVIRNTSDARLGGNVYTKGTTVSINRLNNGAGNRFASVDLVGDDTYTTYGARFIRENTGANASTNILHRGTGALSLYALDAGSVQMITGGTIRLTVSPTGSVTVASLATDGPVYAASGVLSSEQYLDVTRGGTGVGSLTDHGVLVGSGTGDITPLAVGAANYLLMGVNAADPTWGLLTNDNVAASGVANIAWNKLAAGTGNAALRTGVGGYPEVVPVNATATNKFLRQVSSGAPSFEALSASDIPALSYAPAWAGLTVGSLIYANAATTVSEITAVTAGRLLCSNGASTAPYYPAQADLYWDETNNRLGLGMAAQTPKARLTLGWQAATDRAFIWADGSTVGGANYICGFGIQDWISKEYWPSNYSKRWGTMSVADGTTWAEMMQLTTGGRLQVGVATSGSDQYRVCAYGSDTGGNAIGVAAWNIADHNSAYATFRMASGAAGTKGGLFFGSRAALAPYGIANGVTFGPIDATQDIGFRVGTDLSGGATGPTVLIDSNKRMKIGQGSTAPLTKLHIYDENATTNNVLDVLTIDRGVTGAGVGAAGLGAGIALRLENGKVGGGVMTEAGRISAVWTDPANGAEDASLDLWVTSNSTPTKRLSIADTGILTLSGYSTLGLMSINASGVVGYVADGAAGKYLKTDGAGTWTWDTPAASVTAPLTLTVADAATNTVTDILTVEHTTSGAAAWGFGAGLPFNLENAAGTSTPAVKLSAVWFDPANASEDSYLSVRAMIGGVDISDAGSEVARIGLANGPTITRGISLLADGVAHGIWWYDANRGHSYELYQESIGTNMLLDGSNTGSLMAWDDANGRVGVLNPSPAYPLDVTGDINTTTTYRTNGIAGLSATYNVAGTAGSGTLKTMTFSGGILTAVTTW